MIILVADTMLGYHSEEGWTGLIDVVLAHYGIEAEEKAVVLFVGAGAWERVGVGVGDWERGVCVCVCV
jgi:hypothetical protein